MGNSKIKTIVFPVGGFGTRFLPATKATPKEMLPVAEKPLIQYAFEEAMQAGIEKFIFVTGRNKNSIEDHFDNAFELQKVLSEKKKEELLKKTIGWLPKAGHIVFLRQQEPLGLGHAILCAEKFVGNEPFIVSLADEMVYEEDNYLQKMIKLAEEKNANVLGIAEIDKKNTKKYGVVDTNGKNDDVVEIFDMVEKPEPEDAPSNLSNIGRYILSPKIFEYIKKTEPTINSEVQLTDAMKIMLKEEDKEKFFGLKFKGNRFDCGSVLGYLEANLHYSLNNPKIRNDVVSIIDKFYKKVRNEN